MGDGRGLRLRPREGLEAVEEHEAISAEHRAARTAEIDTRFGVLVQRCELGLDARGALFNLRRMRAPCFLPLLAFSFLAVAGIAKPPYSVGGKTFMTVEQALAHQVVIANESLAEMQPGSYFGGSLLVSLPPDNVLISPTFITGVETLDDESRRYFRQFFRADAEFLVQAFNRSGLFDSVTLTRAVSHWRYAADFGYRYVMVYGGNAGFSLLDMAANTETKVSVLGTGLSGLVNGVERALDDLARQARIKSPGEALDKVGVARAAELPMTEEMSYDEQTRRGWVSVKGRGLEARGSVLRRIGEICASKSKLLVPGDLAARGAFKVLDEELKDGVLKVTFEALDKAAAARAAEPPVTEEMSYDEQTRRGWVSVKGRGLEARESMLRRIAEICATKNKLLVSDEMASRGAFKVLDEELKDGVLKITFEALY
ncbi:MAG: hypothetical protein C0518_10780 [Opitutus sp.]|nr:hypothetical protein [Opitutus sp.]